MTPGPTDRDTVRSHSPPHPLHEGDGQDSGVPSRQAHDLLDLLRCAEKMFASSDESEMLRLAMAEVGKISPCTTEAGYLAADEELTRIPQALPSGAVGVDRQVRDLDGRDGPVELTGEPWSWAFALRGLGRLCGYLVVRCRTQPLPEELPPLRMLVQQVSAALSSAMARADAAKCNRRQRELETVNRRLRSAQSDQERQNNVLDALTAVTVTEGGPKGIARALHELTGLAAVIEDRFGNLKAWAGPGRPDPYPEPDRARYEELLQHATRQLGPVRTGGRLIAPVGSRGDLLGVIALVDPEHQADDYCQFALEHSATSLALELAHLRNLAEVELRMRRELVDDVLEGTDDASAYARGEAVGHDLHGAHYVVAVHWLGGATTDGLVRAVDRSVAAVGMSALLTRHSETVVLLSRGVPPASALYDAVTQRIGTKDIAVGVGGRYDSPASAPRSYREASRALAIRTHSNIPYGTTFFEGLGLYRLLGPRNDAQAVEEFTREWLGALLDYDDKHHTELVETLSQYLECGGRYDDAATALSVHRSTLRYRLQRIREISGRDLSSADTRLNLHVATRAWKVLANTP